jgi:hypothetical protein
MEGSPMGAPLHFAFSNLFSTKANIPGIYSHS